MTRTVLLLTALLVVLVCLDMWLRLQQQQELQTQGRLRPLVPAAAQVEPDRVHRVDLSWGPQQNYTYVRQGETWRFPAYHNALAHSDRMEHLLSLCLGARGTLTPVDSGQRIPIDGAPTLQIGLFDRSQTSLARLQFAGPFAGPAGAHTLARVVGDEHLLTFHADPISVVGRGQPPMLDPHLMPRSLAAGALVEVEAQTGSTSWRLWRILAARPADGPPVPVDDAQHYRWLLERSGRVDTCRTESVTAYLAYLRRLRVDGLTTAPPAEEADLLRLVDEDGVIDELVLPIKQDMADRVAIHNTRAQIVGWVSPDRVALMMSPDNALLDSLERPTLFERALQSTLGATP